MNALRLQFMRLRKKLNLEGDVCAYMIRHVWGTQAILNGLGLETVAEAMGHSSVEMASTVHVHLAEQHGHLHAAMEKATENLSPPMPGEEPSGQDA